VTTNDRAAFVELMLGLGEAFGETISATRLEVYFSALRDLDVAVLRQAATVHVQTQRFFPRVVELREAIEGRVDDRADLAWVGLLQLVRQVGFWGEPTWMDPVMRRAALELYGGWQALCERLPGSGPELLGAAKIFKATYVAYARRETREQLPALTREEARGRLVSLRDELAARGLPAPGLPDPPRSGPKEPA
jgi:hypothetical protein